MLALVGNVVVVPVSHQSSSIPSFSQSSLAIFVIVGTSNYTTNGTIIMIMVLSYIFSVGALAAFVQQLLFSQPLWRRT